MNISLRKRSNTSFEVTVSDGGMTLTEDVAMLDKPDGNSSAPSQWVPPSSFCSDSMEVALEALRMRMEGLYRDEGCDRICKKIVEHLYEHEAVAIARITIAQYPELFAKEAP